MTMGEAAPTAARSGSIAPTEAGADHLSVPPTAFVVENFKQAMESYRAAMLSVISACTVLAVVNASLVGYAVNEQLAALLLVGPIFPLTMVASVFLIRRMQTPMAYTLLNLEHRFGGTSIDLTATTFLSAVTSPAYVEKLLAIGHIADRAERMREIDRNQIPIIGSGHGVFRVLLALVAIGQPAGALVMWQFAGWRMF